MKDWKTTLIGGIGAVLFIGYKLKKGLPIEFTDITLALSMLGLGIASKDATSQSTAADVAAATRVALDKAIPPDGKADGTETTAGPKA